MAGHTDIVSKATRSRMMRAVGQRDTGPEIAVKRLVRGLGAAYRIRNGDLPGSPDLANRKRRWAIFVNGCFWHGHKNCAKTKGGRGSRIPRQNSTFWRTKLTDNRVRDATKCHQLRASGFRVAIVWECELRDVSRLTRRLAGFLGVDG